MLAAVVWQREPAVQTLTSPLLAFLPAQAFTEGHMECPVLLVFIHDPL